MEKIIYMSETTHFNSYVRKESMRLYNIIEIFINLIFLERLNNLKQFAKWQKNQ